MNGTIPTKIARLALNLSTHPRFAPRWLAHSVFNGRSPLDLELPWFSYAAIEFLEQFVRPHMTICEYGSGGSTVFFARRARRVFSIEDNPSWFERVAKQLDALELRNVTMRLCPFDFKEPLGFEQSEYLHAMPEEPLDIVVIDSSEEWEQVRPICFRHAENRINSGGIIVVDDSWRYPELRTANRARRVKVFQSVGPCRPGVTSTDVFFY